MTKQDKAIWKDGAMQYKVSVPKAQVLDFIEKLMKATKGTAIVREIK